MDLAVTFWERTSRLQPSFQGPRRSRARQTPARFAVLPPAPTPWAGHPPRPSPQRALGQTRAGAEASELGTFRFTFSPFHSTHFLWDTGQRTGNCDCQFPNLHKVELISPSFFFFFLFGFLFFLIVYPVSELLPLCEKSCKV